MTNEERDNILDQHKEIYDGYVTQYANTNEQPLYVQDLANDKNGITVNNRGEVGQYRNTNINEMKYDGKDTGLFSGEAEKSAKSDIKKHFSKPAKRPFHYEEDPSEDWPKHEVDYDTEFNFELDEEEVGPPLDMIADREDDVKHGTVDFEDYDDDIFDDMEEIDIMEIHEQLNNTLDMFNRFKKY